MGKTRRRVTLLVLSLESMGLLMLLLAAYLAGDYRLSCERAADGVEQSVVCQAQERRCLWLMTVHRQQFTGVRDAVSRPPALGRSDHWLSVVTEDGELRVLAGSANATKVDVKRLRGFLAQDSRGPLVLSRSAAPWAVAAAIFGCLWLLFISLIMREFLGYHTPWWVRILR